MSLAQWCKQDFLESGGGITGLQNVSTWSEIYAEDYLSKAPPVCMGVQKMLEIRTSQRARNFSDRLVSRAVTALSFHLKYNFHLHKEK